MVPALERCSYLVHILLACFLVWTKIGNNCLCCVKPGSVSMSWLCRSARAGTGVAIKCQPGPGPCQTEFINFDIDTILAPTSALNFCLLSYFKNTLLITNNLRTIYHLCLSQFYVHCLRTHVHSIFS